MTEAEWLGGTDPVTLLAFAAPLAKTRKLRLLACGCVRLRWSHLSAEGHRAIKVAEQYADGAATLPQLWEAHRNCPTSSLINLAANCAAYGGRLFRRNAPFALLHSRESEADKPVQAELVRDVYGNPFRPLARCPRAWKTSTVLALAQGIYDQRAFDRMPILADALQDAGCGDERVVSHCLDPAGRHVRGCWVLDLILGKK